MTRRARLDAEIVRRGLAPSRTEAAQLIDEKRVLVNGAVADKTSRQVHPGDSVVVSGPPPRFVSRGGEKLDAALAHWNIDVRGLRVLDAGASTGGFTDCLLQRGAAHVVAADVGHGQLHPRIRDDARVSVLEHYNVREIGVDDIGGLVDAVVADLSFISLTLVATRLVSVCRDDGEVIVLVKPQFEVGRIEASRGKGIVTDPLLWDEACQKVSAAFDAAGATPIEVIESPLLGGEGNKEFLLRARVRARLST
jgi:23S rRNA (cytidine1920-2'-O)/16S rRNA (cytidine1409-2'-O)-methyltransferase